MNASSSVAPRKSAPLKSTLKNLVLDKSAKRKGLFCSTKGSKAARRFPSNSSPARSCTKAPLSQTLPTRVRPGTERYRQPSPTWGHSSKSTGWRSDAIARSTLCFGVRVKSSGPINSLFNASHFPAPTVVASALGTRHQAKLNPSTSTGSTKRPRLNSQSKTESPEGLCRRKNQISSRISSRMVM